MFVIDLAAHKVLKAVKVGPRPRSVAFLPDGSRAYVPSENGGTCLYRHQAAHRRQDDQARDRDAADGHGGGTRWPMLYVTTGRSKMLLIIDPKTNAVIGSVEAGPRPWGVAISSDGNTLYTANGPSNDVSVIDAETRSVTTKFRSVAAHGALRWSSGHRTGGPFRRPEADVITDAWTCSPA